MDQRVEYKYIFCPIERMQVKKVRGKERERKGKLKWNCCV